ncbi:MAG: HAMP domain-containing sensor histidine kinase [Candidatus Sumerlaeales bacterium]|nr:HAMP domain-containing sensor histidine kinase [Candidatus Sumerlaeales bacterium]
MAAEKLATEKKSYMHNAQSVVRHVRLRMWVAIPALVILVVLTPFVTIFYLNVQDSQSNANDSTFFFALIFSLIVGTCIGVGLAINILSPLKELESLGRAAASGKPIAQVNIKNIETIANKGNEIGMIGLSFAESLMQISHEVSNHNRELMEKLAIGIAIIDGERNIQAINQIANVMLGVNDAVSQSGILRKTHGNSLLSMNSKLNQLIDSAEKNKLDELTDVISLDYDSPSDTLHSTTGLKPELENSHRVHIKITALHDADTTSKSWMIAMTDLRRQDFLLQQILTEETATTLNTFVRGLAHEIKTPLTTIRLRAQMLSEDIENMNDSDNQSKEFLLDHASSIDDETHRLESIVKDVRDFVYLSAKNNKESEPPEEFDIVELAKSVTTERATLNAFKAQSENSPHNPTIEFRADEIERAMCYGSSDRMRQAIHNLLNNAIQHTYDDGHVLVSVRHEAVGSFPIKVCVENTGTPIDEQTQRRIFEPFFSTGASGTGLGLPIALQITLAHQGTLTQENLPDGVRFTIQLPDEWTPVNKNPATV